MEDYGALKKKKAVSWWGTIKAFVPETKGRCRAGCLVSHHSCFQNGDPHVFENPQNISRRGHRTLVTVFTTGEGLWGWGRPWDVLLIFLTSLLFWDYRISTYDCNKEHRGTPSAFTRFPPVVTACRLQDDRITRMLTLIQPTRLLQISPMLLTHVWVCVILHSFITCADSCSHQHGGAIARPIATRIPHAAAPEPPLPSSQIAVSTHQSCSSLMSYFQNFIEMESHSMQPFGICLLARQNSLKIHPRCRVDQ